jgi:hypothetical protein
MGMHISARLAWHDDGWNGHICSDPRKNTYCSGRHSYPGDLIAIARRKDDWEAQPEFFGRDCSTLERMPPCMYSINAFGKKQLKASSEPPDFSDFNAQKHEWEMPASTVCVWPYEEMYSNEVKRAGGGYDNDKRFVRAKALFEQLTEDNSLIFYYANYSNPFSEEENQRYVVVGMARIKKVGDWLFYPGADAETRQKYGGAFVWQKPITSHYPEQGLRLPYHLYRDRPDVLDNILFVPDNARNFKYAARLISDDDALSLVERFLGIARYLERLGDRTDDWGTRARWIEGLISELWRHRGLYPGATEVFTSLGFTKAIPYFKAEALAGREHEAHTALFKLLDGEIDSVPTLALTPADVKNFQREWRLKRAQHELLRDVLPRFALTRNHIDRVLSPDRDAYGIAAKHPEIVDNPYVLSEQYVGDSADDVIPFPKIDHGMLPSPELGGEPLASPNDARRLRALCVDRLKREESHSFLPARLVIHDVNHRLSFQPDYKRHQFTEEYLEVDQELLSKAITVRLSEDAKYLYLKDVHGFERAIEKVIRELANRPVISLKTPVTETHWREFLYDADSALAQKFPKRYAELIAGQGRICSEIFLKPVCVIAGEAGTGKTTVIKALLKAIRKADGTGASIQMLAPTGKAADRIRRATQDSSALTVHSFLAKKGWLYKNLTFKRSGGEQADNIQTVIIDESSMMNLELTAALFRSINWSSVRRLILVGDPNQLPPIGRGRFFADVIEWLEAHQGGSVGVLPFNIRQEENRLMKRGTGILDLASVFISRNRQNNATDREVELKKLRDEEVLGKVQEGGNVNTDLHVLYWHEAQDLESQLLQELVSDMESMTGQKLNPERTYELWAAARKDSSGKDDPTLTQVLSPYRGELFGTESLNSYIQAQANGNALEKFRAIDGITLFDKVIQYFNRPKSNPLSAYNCTSRKTEYIEVFNGEIGMVKPHGFDKGKLGWFGFHLKHFQVVFSGKENYWVNYGRDLGKDEDSHWLSSEGIEGNLELAYVISIHKAQGSEFGRTYLVIPKQKKALLSSELLYTGITRARTRCTLFIQDDVGTLLSMSRPESSKLARINSSLFDFNPLPEAWVNLYPWYEEGKIHTTLTNYMVQSKSEVIITNLLASCGLTFRYDIPLFAPDGTFYRPDFTIKYAGEDIYWEHLGMLDDEKYANHWKTKEAWYNKYFQGRLVITKDSPNLTAEACQILKNRFGCQLPDGAKG